MFTGEVQLHVPLDEAVPEIVGRLHEAGFAIVANVEIAPDEASPLIDRPSGRAVLLRASYPHVDSASYFANRHPRDLVRCTITLQETSRRTIQVEIRRSGRQLNPRDSDFQRLAEEADQRLQEVFFQLEAVRRAVAG